MARPIKFRAWWENTFQYFELSEMDSGTAEIAGKSPVQQFTGLADSKGKEIYEGDIIRWRDYHRRWVEPAEIEWSSDYLGWQPFCGTLIAGSDSLEIIGNKHENPELLK